MAQKPKPRAKVKPRSKPRFDDKAQSERFVEAARKLGIEEAGHAFDETFRKIATPKVGGLERKNS
jgi:hypothetical protein